MTSQARNGRCRALGKVGGRAADLESIESEKENEAAAAEVLTGRMVKNKSRRKIT
jgi:hypothetical protein